MTSRRRAWIDQSLRDANRGIAGLLCLAYLDVFGSGLCPEQGFEVWWTVNARFARACSILRHGDALGYASRFRVCVKTEASCRDVP